MFPLRDPHRRRGLREASDGQLACLKQISDVLFEIALLGPSVLRGTLGPKKRRSRYDLPEKTSLPATDGTSARPKSHLPVQKPTLS